MTFSAASTKQAAPTRDREIIRVDFADDKIGIAAALRQAFSAAAEAPSNCDFDRFLNELN